MAFSPPAPAMHGLPRALAGAPAYLSAAPAGALAFTAAPRACRPGDVVRGAVAFDGARPRARPEVWLFCEVARRAHDLAWRAGGGAVRLPPGYQRSLPRGAAGGGGARWCHCAGAFRGGGALRVPAVAPGVRVGSCVEFEFEFVLPDALPHAYTWRGERDGRAAFVDVRYRLVAAVEVAGCVVLAEDYLQVMSALTPRRDVYLAPCDARRRRAARHARLHAVSCTPRTRQSITLQIWRPEVCIDAALAVRVTCAVMPHVAEVEVDCAIREDVSVGSAHLKRHYPYIASQRHRRSVMNGYATFEFVLSLRAPNGECQYPSARIGDLIVAHSVFAAVVGYRPGGPFASPSIVRVPPGTLEVSLPLILNPPELTPLEPNDLYHQLASRPFRPRIVRTSAPNPFDEPSRREPDHARHWPRAPRPRHLARALGATSYVTLYRMPSETVPGLDDTCSICLEDLKPGTTLGALSCNHSCFHRACLEDFISFTLSKGKPVLCPICRESARQLR